MIEQVFLQHLGRLPGKNVYIVANSVVWDSEDCISGWLPGLTFFKNTNFFSFSHYFSHVVSI